MRITDKIAAMEYPAIDITVLTALWTVRTCINEEMISRAEIIMLKDISVPERFIILPKI